MPYLHARVSVSIDDNDKQLLQSKLTDIIEKVFSKPKTYIMSEIVDGCALYMAGKRPEASAYISVGMLGSTTKDKCADATESICKLLETEYGIDGSKIYITYHPADLWGWNGSMF